MTVLRQIKRKFGIAAPRVAVRTHAPWYLRWVLILGGITCVIGVAWMTYDTGRALAGFQSGQAAAEQERLSEEVAHLRDENALLKEDLAFFQTLMTSGGDASGSGISINRFRVRPDALPGEYRYQLLIVQSRIRGREFQGKLQLVVDLEQDGQQQVLMLPRADEKSGPYNLSFKFYQRVDGVFKVAPEATVKRVQVRVLENGTDAPKSSQTVNLS